MSGGGLKIGNKYGLDRQNIILRDREMKDGLKVGDLKLNKIEIRYNTRKGESTYPAMKSLYRWRSVFGFRLGGLLRQGVVKMAEVVRPLVNTKRLIAKLATGKLHHYNRLYSTREVANVMKAMNPNNPGAGRLKYMTYWQLSAKMHSAASGEDHSLRTILLTTVAKRHAIADVRNVMKGMGREKAEIEKSVKEFKQNLDKHSYVGMLAGNAKDRLKFRLDHQIARLRNFFKDWKAEDRASAYKQLVAQSREDRMAYYDTFHLTKNAEMRFQSLPQALQHLAVNDELGKDLLVALKNGQIGEHHFKEALHELAEVREGGTDTAERLKKITEMVKDFNAGRMNASLYVENKDEPKTGNLAGNKAQNDEMETEEIRMDHEGGRKFDDPQLKRLEEALSNDVISMENFRNQLLDRDIAIRSGKGAEWKPDLPSKVRFVAEEDMI